MDSAKVIKIAAAVETVQLHRNLQDQEWRINNLYWIKDKKGRRVKFKMKPLQLRLLRREHRRKIILKARQLGFTTFIQIYMLDLCLFRPDTNAGVIAHNREDAQAFFKDKIKYALDQMEARHLRGITATNDSAGELRFTNGSVIRVGTSLRSGTYQLIHISEFGKLCAKFPDRAEEVKSGTLPTVPSDGEIFIESTAEGRSGIFFDMCATAMRDRDESAALTALDFDFIFEPWFDDPDNVLNETVFAPDFDEYFENLEHEGIKLSAGQRAWYVKTERTQGDAMKREHPSTEAEAFEASMEGAYFSKQMAAIRAKGQILRIPLDPRVPVETFWDLGRDTTAIWFFQRVGFDYRFFDYYENSGEEMAHYIGVLKDRTDGDIPYLYGDAYLPHDGTRKSLASRDTPADILYNAGFYVRIVERTTDKQFSIEHARQVLPMCFFDKERCIDGILHLDSYRKEWDLKLGTWKKSPLHDSHSHGADAFMTFADGYYHESESEKYQEEHVDRRGRNSTTGY